MTANSGDDLTTPTAPILLKKFLDDNNIELRLTPPAARLVDGGGVLVEQSQLVADFKKVDSIETKTN